MVSLLHLIGMGLPSNCKVYNNNISKIPQHCLLQCFRVRFVWEPFLKVWWWVPIVAPLSLPFVLLGDIGLEHSYDSQWWFFLQKTFVRHLEVFLVGFRCKNHLDDDGYSNIRILIQQAWTSIVEVGMTKWHTINIQISNRNISFKLTFIVLSRLFGWD